MISWKLFGFVCCALLIKTADSFYVPGVAPVEFRKDQAVEIKV